MTTETNITAETSADQLPDDTNTLKQMVLTLLGQIDDLSGQLYYLKRQLFGKKSEKLNPAQRLLFENLYDQVKAKVEEQRQPEAMQNLLTDNPLDCHVSMTICQNCCRSSFNDFRFLLIINSRLNS